MIAAIQYGRAEAPEGVRLYYQRSNGAYPHSEWSEQYTIDDKIRAPCRIIATHNALSVFYGPRLTRRISKDWGQTWAAATDILPMLATGWDLAVVGDTVVVAYCADIPDSTGQSVKAASRLYTLRITPGAISEPEALATFPVPTYPGMSPRMSTSARGISLLVCVVAEAHRWSEVTKTSIASGNLLGQLIYSESRSAGRTWQTMIHLPLTEEIDLRDVGRIGDLGGYVPAMDLIALPKSIVIVTNIHGMTVYESPDGKQWPGSRRVNHAQVVEAPTFGARVLQCTLIAGNTVVTWVHERPRYGSHANNDVVVSTITSPTDTTVTARAVWLTGQRSYTTDLCCLAQGDTLIALWCGDANVDPTGIVHYDPQTSISCALVPISALHTIADTPREGNTRR